MTAARQPPGAQEGTGPDRIWLEPNCCADPSTGSLWCEDNVWQGTCDDGVPPTEYVRADVATRKVAEAVAAERERCAKIAEPQSILASLSPAQLKEVFSYDGPEVSGQPKAKGRRQNPDAGAEAFARDLRFWIEDQGADDTVIAQEVSARIARKVAEAVAAERERCAKLTENFSCGPCATIRMIAARIRSGGEP